jgi:PPOX class probable F420-dependent enzyme
MGIPLSPEVKQLIDRPNFAHLGTLMPDGSPQCVPVWVGREGDHVVICTGENSLKAKNTRRDARVALSIIDFTNPYEEVQIRGRVVERRPDPDLKVMDPISHKYTGKPFPFRSPEGRVALMIKLRRRGTQSCRSSIRRGKNERRGLRRASCQRCFQLTTCLLPVCYPR